jgi:cytochrome c oxidase cbb3-type subunit 2
LVCGWLAIAPFSWGTDVELPGLHGDTGRGKQLYKRYCVGCHGVHGDGTGENAVYLDPRPRDFTAGVFKCRSTPTGSLPLDTDLFDTITRGMYASAMPPWQALRRQERADLLAYVKDFCPRYKLEKPEPALVIPPEPATSEASIGRGLSLYQKMECGKCHGKEGRGNGRSASTLTDSKDRPIVPYDFTTGDRFKCGRTNEDLYRIFMTGLDGTPMPSFRDNIQPDEAWDLVHYLRTLQGGGKR